MEPDLEHDIRHLAYHIWQTAGRDFWLDRPRFLGDGGADVVE